MNIVHYFINHNRWVALIPDHFSEVVTFCYYENQAYPFFASIEFHASTIPPEWYERVENGYSASTYEEYTEARRKAQAALANFFGDTAEFTAPSTRPEYVERGGELILNDLPL